MKILVLPGDGIGPEIVAASVVALCALDARMARKPACRVVYRRCRGTRLDGPPPAVEHRRRQEVR
jgi:isocitrate/isopropylmalate dehydrogenase